MWAAWVRLSVQTTTASARGGTSLACISLMPALGLIDTSNLQQAGSVPPGRCDQKIPSGKRRSMWSCEPFNRRCQVVVVFDNIIRAGSQ